MSTGYIVVYLSGAAILVFGAAVYYFFIIKPDQEHKKHLR